jgi:hypothetical protein
MYYVVKANNEKKNSPEDSANPNEKKNSPGDSVNSYSTSVRHKHYFEYAFITPFTNKNYVVCEAIPYRYSIH